MRKQALLLCIIVLTVPLPRLEATTLVRLTLDQLSQAATEIVRGRAVHQETRWNAEHTLVVTLTTIALTQTIKGHAPDVLVIEQPGGTLGNLRVRVAGTARFLSQTDYLLFLEPSRAAPSRYHTVGMVQGVYRIYRDVTTREEHVILPLSDLSWRGGDAGSAARRSAQTLPLSEFRQKLSGALENPLVIPQGTSIPVVIQSTEPLGVGRLRITGRVVSEIYPNARTLIPTGSLVDGTAQLVSGTWRIRWTEVSVRGTRATISAISEQPAGPSLRGRKLWISVR